MLKDHPSLHIIFFLIFQEYTIKVPYPKLIITITKTTQEIKHKVLITKQNQHLCILSILINTKTTSKFYKEIYNQSISIIF